jgi:RimJ/RimL family protein N-acetyltransferase
MMRLTVAMRALVTDICVLEPQIEVHAASMFPVLSDRAIYEFEGQPPPSVEALAAGYRRKESRRSPDGSEVWLNWVVRLPGGEFTGYVQATVLQDGYAYVGYEFASRYWRRGVATAALRAVLQELANEYHVRQAVAVLKKANYRSLGLLHKLGFVAAEADTSTRFDPEADESVLLRRCAP